MIRIPLPFAAVSAAPAFLLMAALSACSKPAPPAPPPAPVAQAPAAPAKPMKMVCRNSQTGAKAECGAPNAVMVGMEPS